MKDSEKFELNRETWNKKVSVHLESEFYEMSKFTSGESSLHQYEIEALGNISNKDILHLQCHFGQDTLSLARLGARCTGVDFSEEGIKVARQLNETLSLKAQFVCCNVLDTAKFVSEKFDVVFTSYGIIGWLPDLQPWAAMISEKLKPGGFFYIVEFHPIAWMFDYTVSPPLMKYGYHQKEAIYEEYQGTYADKNSKMISREYGWNHSLGEVVTALSEAGLIISYVKEHDASPYDIFPGLVKNNNGMYELDNKMYPLIFEIKAMKNN
ncbi:class I SAM-dependent methyltransferase [Aequorivita sp. SDUM287046]|uniref:Class I SAM-dependent methyltransferase n=1 Tax=Aequorivita aurantiaca TaxID=3053356 RepID=A0ABT8DHV9_9FLAO|nr:class I SAM-dependent methyltransferase [Aequorivita aurantiaca]MDN3724573.1 class I SAM-dependent methyltransferase [Aequorivita aurantiaca]